jgi:EAL domain-containing protein (putative c-di-GMP-specific phosphodiesterase class I)/GGDEF domain-containing protein
MSLIRQLWLLLAAMLALAMGGAVGINLWATRELLQTQLSVKNSDNALALAQVLSQQRGDPVLMALVVSAQFDTGSYSMLRVLDAEGHALVSQRGDSTARHAPAWFVSLLPIAAPPGVAQVSDGWRPVGQVEVASRANDAHDALWRGSLRAAALMAAVGAAGALVAWAGVRRIRRSLRAMAEQAQSLVDGRYLQVEAPQVPELQHIALAMNGMVERVRSLFEAQATQAEQLRREAHCDALTGLPHRVYFMQRLSALLQREDGVEGGGLVLVRLADVATLNRHLGRRATDEILLSISQVLQAYPERAPECFVGRLNGADFGLCLPTSGVAAETAESVCAALRPSLPAFGTAVQVHVGAVELQRGAGASALMAQADLALARAEARGPFAVEVLGGGQAEHLGQGERAWRSQVLAAIEGRRGRLVHFPVIGRREELVHLECPLRLQLEVGGDFEPAVRWLPLVVRHRLTATVDSQAVGLALDAIARDGRARAVNLSPASLADGGFAGHLRGLLQDRPQAAGLLWLEVAESAALERFEELQGLSRLLRPLGVRFGLEHAGARLHRIERLYELGLDYVKFDASVCAGIAQSEAAQEFMRSTAALLHALSVQVHAEGLSDAADVLALWGCGVDAVTGPWASARWVS